MSLCLSSVKEHSDTNAALNFDPPGRRMAALHFSMATEFEIAAASPLQNLNAATLCSLVKFRGSLQPYCQSKEVTSK